ncbi:MAG: CaiB/BaiF CoA transferase family protein [Pseudorhodoplanes sp.]
MGSPRKLLEGLRVVSLTGGIAGPVTARTLAQFGAEVIKLESHNGGLDSFRYYSTSDDIEASGRFLECNLNVRSALLNLKTETGLKLFLELVAKTDILVENYRPTVLPKLGAGPDVLRKIKPDLIYLKLPGMGSTGPKNWFGTWGQTLNAISGMTHLWNHPDQPAPVGFQGAYPDYVAGALGPTTIMAALLRRRRTGKGVFLELAQAEMCAAILGVNYLQALVNNDEPMPVGNTSTEYAPHNAYPCDGEDRWCAIAVQTQAQWRKLCDAMGDPKLADDPRFSSMIARHRNAAALDAIIAAWTRTRDATDVMMTLQKAGVPCGMVQRGEDLFADPQLLARKLKHVVQHASMGEMPVTNIPIHFADAAFDAPRTMSNLGADNEHVYCGLLGYSREQLSAWEADGVVK